ncbi:MAG: hypothetical protein ACKVWV_20345 [Planctomycetota bacterium]
MTTSTPAPEEGVIRAPLAVRLKEHVARHLAWLKDVFDTEGSFRGLRRVEGGRLRREGHELLVEATGISEQHATLEERLAAAEQRAHVLECEVQMVRADLSSAQRRNAELLLELARDPEQPLTEAELDEARDVLELDVRARCH